MTKNNPNPSQPRPTGAQTTPLLYCKTKADQAAYRLDRAEQALERMSFAALHYERVANEEGRR